MTRQLAPLFLGLSLIVFAATPARALSHFNPAYAPYLGELPRAQTDWFAAAFEIYEKAFVKPDGRVFDPQNGGITHSESQGYGMMLALLGSDRQAFSSIWSFAKRRMQRADKLFAWKWVPGQGITDRNNATDGDILIATALALAGFRWDEPRYVGEAEAIARAVGRKLLVEYGGYHFLLPGEWAKPTRYNPKLTLNLSYFIPLTLPILEALAPREPWERVLRDGPALLDALINPPSDWSTINEHGEPGPAPGYPRRFSYDAVRIPLYLLQFGQTNRKLSNYLINVWGDDDRHDIFSFDVFSFSRLDRFWGNSYQFMYEMVHCIEKGEPVDYASMSMKMDNYFDSSLHLMALASMYASWPECFPGGHGVARPRS